MTSKKSWTGYGRLMLLVLAIFLATGVYMFMRHMSLELTWRRTRQESEHRVLVEKRDRLQAELQHLAGFARLDSVWISNGRPAAYQTAGRPDHWSAEIMDIAESRQ